MLLIGAARFRGVLLLAFLALGAAWSFGHVLTSASFGRLVDLEVNEDHDERGDVKRPHGRVQHVTNVLAQRADWPIMVRRRLVPTNQRRYANGRRDEPDDEDHDGGALGRALSGVVDGLGDGPVAVQGDEAEAVDGGRAQQHVRGLPHLAEDGAEVPVAHQLVGQREGHDKEPQQEVGQGQGADEVVLRALEVLVLHDGPHDQEVAHHDHQDDDGDDDAGADDVRPRVAARVARGKVRLC